MARRWGVSFLFLSIVALSCVEDTRAAFYDAGSNVLSIDSVSAFERKVMGAAPKSVWMVEFYAPWCGHCQKLKPEWIKAATNLKGIVNFAAVDCDEESNKALAARYEIGGFPTIKVFIDGRATDYNGGRTAKAIVEFAMQQLPSNVVKVTTASEKDFLSTDMEMPKALLFSKKSTTSPLYKSLSSSFEGRMKFGEVYKGEKSFVAKYEVAEFPTLFVIPAGKDGKPLRYFGELKPGPIRAFLKRHALPGDFADSLVPLLADESCMKATCVDEGGICIFVISSDNPDESLTYIDTLEEAASSSDSRLFRFGWINGTNQREFVSKTFGLETIDYPRLVALSYRKGRYALFVGALSTESVNDFLIGLTSGRVSTSSIGGSIPPLAGDTVKCKSKPQPKPIPKKSTQSGSTSSSKESFSIKLTSQNFKLTSQNFKKEVLDSKLPVLVEFFAPWCGHCKNLAPHWEKAANALKGTVKFGAVDATVETTLASTYGIKGYPSIKMFKVGDKKGSPDDYNGARTAKALVDQATYMLPNKVTNVKDSKLDEFLHKGSLGKLLLLTDKTKTPSIMKSLAIEFEGDIDVGTIKATDKTMRKFGIEKAPALFVFPPGGTIESKIPYTGSLHLADIQTYVKSQIQTLKASNDKLRDEL